MKESIVINATSRPVRGTSASGRLRRQGRLPAVVYSEGRPGQNVQVEEHGFSRMLLRHHGENMIVDLVVDEQAPRKVLLKEIQRHPVSGACLHIDFHEISMTRKLRISVPVRLVGIPVGVSQGGGILDHILREIEIECLPVDLIEEIPVDVSALELGHHVAVSDVKLDPARYRVLSAADLTLATVSAPQAEPTAEETAAATAATAAEPEVLTAKKPEEGAEAEKKGAEPAGKKGGEKAEKKGAEPAGKKGGEKAEKK